MKTKIIAAAVAAMAASSAFAVQMAASSGDTEICTGAAASVAIEVAASPAFIQERFNQGCSNNVYMTVAEDNISAWAVSASKKGKYYFIGNTNGGAPRAKTSATVDPATAPTPTTYMNDAKLLGASS